MLRPRLPAATAAIALFGAGPAFARDATPGRSRNLTFAVS